MERTLEKKKRNKQEYLQYSLAYEGYFRTKMDANLGIESKNIFWQFSYIYDNYNPQSNSPVFTIQEKLYRRTFSHGNCYDGNGKNGISKILVNRY